MLIVPQSGCEEDLVGQHLKLCLCQMPRQIRLGVCNSFVDLLEQFRKQQYSVGQCGHGDAFWDTNANIWDKEPNLWRGA